ncbi:dynamin family protein [Cytobacillus sp. FJAT-54145]|uniref:Dynamin family protein n=1 Tax=Cytobacillus spartinae TaxID=3299023 RepID=A0ABW6KH24_9BACI
MVQTVNQQEKTELLNQIAGLYTLFKENNDIQTAEKAKQLAIKLHDEEFSIGFCGHFSAGKSSMINKIIGENLLPSSPIPTSANLVKVKSGEEYAKVFFKERNPILYPAPYNYEKVKSYCKDGDLIQSIEISHNTNKLPKEAAILDTPGIDSTDDAHRIATESALHLADLVFYVMDYNHVQSELNFLFTKELTTVGKDVYLIINQIDKHRDEELSFEHFTATVKDSFASWGVKPAKIFYTSLKEENHPFNQFHELQQFIHAKIESRDTILPSSIYHSLKKLMEEHSLTLKQEQTERLNRYEEILNPIAEEEQQELPTRLKEVHGKLQLISEKVNQKDIDFSNELDEVLKNAYLMPFQTRDLAEKYLHSQQPDFKVGLFFSKQKTEQERSEREESFFKDLQEKVRAQLDWHLKELLINTFKQEDIQNPDLLAKAQSLAVPITKAMLKDTIKPGARPTGDYVLNYTNDVAEAIKKVSRNKVNEIKELYLQILKDKADKQAKELAEDKELLEQYVDAWEKKQAIFESQMAVEIKMEQIISGHADVSMSKDALEQLVTDDKKVEVVHNLESEQVEKVTKENGHKPNIQVEEEKEQNNVENIHDLVNKLTFTANQLKPIPGFKKITNDLLQKAERLGNRGFTVALFGAFSAGKSSFANALIGHKLLPVSPNPTTAAINKIMPIDDENPHGSVKVKLKPSNVLLEDVTRSLEVFGSVPTDFDEALKQIKHVMENSTDFDAYEKTHYAFLQAFYKGFEPFRDQLGEILVTDLTEFSDFVAKEEKSCLVETIEVFFDCELTRKGITLVDTPGADSINARHTGVAFEYIKNSDAILFVTYYNHAFSKADREFLIQLGRVKDAFELDKMFFIVNAIDLANNDEEMNDVLDYVEDQLIKFGIRRPSLFPVSSLRAIEEKLELTSNRESGIHRFENQFYSFIENDLTEIAVNAAKFEWQRAVELLRNYIVSSQEDKGLKEKRKLDLENEQKKITAFIQNESPDLLIQRLNQESDELTYYIKQRVFLRFSDFFKESFNPSVLKDDGRNLKKALQHALDDLLSSFGFDFSQELRATTLRLETFISKLISQKWEATTKELHEFNGDLSFSKFESQAIEGLDFNSPFEDVNKDTFKKSMSYFKNPKSFFENNEKRLMMEELERVLQDPAQDYLLKENEKLKGYYDEQLKRQFELLLSHLLEEVNDYYEGMFAALSNHVSIEQLQQLEEKILHS